MGGEVALVDMSCKKPILKNRVSEHIEQSVINLAIENPILSQLLCEPRTNEVRYYSVIQLVYVLYLATAMILRLSRNASKL